MDFSHMLGWNPHIEVGNRVTNRAYGERRWNRGLHDRPIRMPSKQRFTNSRVAFAAGEGNLYYKGRGNARMRTRCQSRGEKTALKPMRAMHP